MNSPTTQKSKDKRKTMAKLPKTISSTPKDLFQRFNYSRVSQTLVMFVSNQKFQS